jgi:hypothetical protein
MDDAVLSRQLCCLWSPSGLVTMSKETRANAANVRLLLHCVRVDACAQVCAHLYADLSAVGAQLGYTFDDSGGGVHDV